MRFVDEYFRRERLTGHGLPSHVGDLQEIGRLDRLRLSLGKEGTDGAKAFCRDQLLRGAPRRLMIVVGTGDHAELRRDGAGVAARAAVARLSFRDGRSFAAARLRRAMLTVEDGMQPVAENSRAAIHQQNQARES